MVLGISWHSRSQTVHIPVSQVDYAGPSLSPTSPVDVDIETAEPPVPPPARPPPALASAPPPPLAGPSAPAQAPPRSGGPCPKSPGYAAPKVTLVPGPGHLWDAAALAASQSKARPSALAAKSPAKAPPTKAMPSRPSSGSAAPVDDAGAAPPGKYMRRDGFPSQALVRRSGDVFSVSTERLEFAVRDALAARLRRLKVLGLPDDAYLPSKETFAAREELRDQFMRSPNARQMYKEACALCLGVRADISTKEMLLQHRRAMIPDANQARFSGVALAASQGHEPPDVIALRQASVIPNRTRGDRAWRD